jgi:glucans biosynthesis protein
VRSGHRTRSDAPSGLTRPVGYETSPSLRPPVATRTLTAPVSVPCHSRTRDALTRVALALLLVAPTVALAAKRAPKPPPEKAPPPAFKFDLETVADKARELAAAPYDPKGRIPDWLTKITYDQWRDIRFKADQALWAGDASPFQVQFFHPGQIYDRAVAINVVTPEGTKPVPFSPTMFDYGKTDFASRVPHDLGFAGFRLHFPIKTPKYRDEVIVFLGASYFRAVGRDQVFGASARGLAIDTAESWGEEFPWFREFWLVRPGADAPSATIYALLDSPRVTGAYRFVVTPGAQTRVDVECRLFLRAEVKKLGIAPLTSMFFHGENSTRRFVDFRPEVHDSDGVLMHLAGGEWLWRPVDNPERLHVSGLRAELLEGFGLIQRDRDFANYQDLETASEHRPSIWIAPWGSWGPGRVEVVEIPTNGDVNDNVATYWVPDAMPKPGQPANFGYTQYWYGDDADRPPGGRAVATRRDPGTIENGARFVIDFAGGKLGTLPPQEVIRAVVTVAGGDEVAEIRDQYVVPNPHVNGWRLSFQVAPKKRSEPIELRAYLELGGEVLTETWSYAILP